MMTVREFLRANMAVFDAVYLDHEAGVLDGICRCRCGYRSSEQDWLLHVADQIADAISDTDAEQPALFAIPEPAA